MSEPRRKARATAADMAIASGLMTVEQVALELCKPDGFLLLPDGALEILAQAGKEE